MADKLTVALTFFVRKPDAGHSIWANGADQQMVFLWQCLQRCENVGKVICVNAGDGDAQPPAMMMDGLGIEFVRLDGVVDEIDVLIEGSGQVAAESFARVRARGGRAVAYKFGNAYVLDAEREIHGKPAGAIFNGSQFDEVWTNPQHVHTCASYWETCYRCPVTVVPHIWDPLFIERAVKEFPADLTWGYQPGRAKKRIVTYEPNFNIVKTAHIPMLACERAFRRSPELFDQVYITNALALKEHLSFQKFAANLDIVKAQRPDGGSVMSFEARFNFPWFQAKHGDIVLAHQWENALNFAYYDAIYGGYPLVHNSPMLPEGVGYRYDGFNAESGAAALLEAMTHHDERREAYTEASTAFINTVLAAAPANVEAYARALDHLFVPAEGRPTPVQQVQYTPRAQLAGAS